MAIGFVIMQIGNPELDAICERVLAPALDECGLEARRVDKHNRGELLKSEIIRFIETADIVLADLTNERPNCYLEIGYVMGVGKFANLILTCRDDHRLDSADREIGGPKVHFDLSGYDILFWRSDKLPEFKEQLVKRIRRRIAILAPASQGGEISLEAQWLNTHRQAALAGLHSLGFTSYMEVRFTLIDEPVSKRPGELLLAAESAAIHASGWPIAVVLMNSVEDRPKPSADGITAEIRSKDGLFGPHYDYWTLRRDAAFFLLQSLIEDNLNSQAIYFDNRIQRVTEALLYCGRVYNRLGILTSTSVRMSIKHDGIKGRALLSGNPRRAIFGDRKASGGAMEITQTFALSDIEPRLVELVKSFTSPMFELFEFWECPDETYVQIVNGFVKDIQANAIR